MIENIERMSSFDAGSALREVSASFDDLKSGADQSWLLLNGALVFFMQAGFSMLEAGSVRLTSTVSVLIKNFGDFLFVSVAFLISYGFAYGRSDTGFIGESNFFIEQRDFASWFFQATFASTSATIVSGCVLERVTYRAYFVFSFFLTFLVYPCVAHWVWSDYGWLSNANDNPGFARGSIDFAGAGVVHLVGGTAGLVGTLIMGPRESAIDSETGSVIKVPGHSVVLQGLGTFILWFGWYGFNCGSTLVISGGNGELAAEIATFTTLCAVAAAFSSCLMYALTESFRIDLSSLMNGLLAGLVASTAGCAVISVPEGLVVGFIAGIAYQLSDIMVLRLGIDDPIDAISVHGTCGIWSLLSAGLFASIGDYKGIFYGGGQLMAAQILEIIVIISWAGIMSFLAFFILLTSGHLTVSLKEQAEGLDIKMGISAYPEIREAMQQLDIVTEFTSLVDQYNNPLLWAFHKFLEIEYAAENLDFIIACREFRRYVSNTMLLLKESEDLEDMERYREEIQKLFKDIYQVYLQSQDITLGSSIKKRISGLIEADAMPLPSSYDICEREIASIIKMGPWKRFKSLIDVYKVSGPEEMSGDKELIADIDAAMCLYEIGLKALPDRLFIFQPDTKVLWVDRTKIKSLISRRAPQSRGLANRFRKASITTPLEIISE